MTNIKIKQKLLHKLLDMYEKSKTYQGENKVRQSFGVDVSKLFPRYVDDAEYEFFCAVNEALTELAQENLVVLTKRRNGTLDRAVLCLAKLSECYKWLGRCPRKDEQGQLWDALTRWEVKCLEAAVQAECEALVWYLRAQKIRIEQNKNVEYYDGSMSDYEDLLKLVFTALNEHDEVYIRTISLQLYSDSKRAEQLKAKAEGLLFAYGDFPLKETVFAECGIVQTPSYIMLKGNGCIEFGDQRLDLSVLHGDIALSTESLKELSRVEVYGKSVVTVENLTSFHTYDKSEDFVIYLGGFHNRIKRDFLLLLSNQNDDVKYWHFGDIDAGGFYILEHLKRKTCLPFRTRYMDIATLKKYQDSAKSLTANDAKRLKQLLSELDAQAVDNCLSEDYRGVLHFMLAENCKLEQEAVEIY